MTRAFSLSLRGLFLLALLAVLPLASAGAQQRQQQPVASPRDTARMRIGGGQVYVDYGRPSARGRKIVGGLVPYGQVWRTGANAATTLVTDVDLRIGGVDVPRGRYTLYTLPTAQRWLLVVNRQTGQWGTVYDASRDLARIPMRVSRTRAPVEKFAISLSPGTGGQGELALEWENTRATVPVAVRAAPRRR
ncbi:MAG TPA: DUF2911 domain-containing protein [Longimicrobiaceae bacterium]